MADTNIKGYTIELDDMKSSTCGMIGIARKEGKKYFCKKFNNPVEPGNSGALSPRATAKNRAEFEAFKCRKLQVNKVLREISGLGGNIICPIEETVYEHHWTEFTEFVEGALQDNQYADVIAKLNDTEKLLVLKIAIGALKTIHGQKIIHGDLKLTNIMLVRNDSGHYVSKIIDFDGAFFEDDVPLDSITGTVDYYSPELAVYSSCEDPEIREKLSKMITTKSDIFTMGLVLHEYLTGDKPKPDHLTTSLQKMQDSKKFIYPWQILLSNDEGETKPRLVINNKITEPAYVALISDMLNLEPERRPAAAEVLKRLNDRRLPIELDVWPGDHIRLNEEKIKENLIGFRKIEVTEKDKPVKYAYEIIECDGRRYNKMAEELIDCGYAYIVEYWEPPRLEDNIEWNLEQLKIYFVSIRPDEKSGAYLLLDKRGNSRLMTVSNLKTMKFARAPVHKEDTPAGDTESLWPEDAYRYRLNEEVLATSHVQFLGRAVMKDIRGYKFKMSNGSEQFFTFPQCKGAELLIEK